VTIAALLLFSSVPAFAQQPAECDAIAARIRAQGKQWEQEEFDVFRRRLVNADLAGATQPGEPLSVTGGLTDDKATAKVKASKAFDGAWTLAWSGSLSSPNAKAIDLFDPLQAATDYSTKIGIGWSRWKDFPAESLLKRRCDAAKAATPQLEALTAAVAPVRETVTVSNPIAFAASYEIGRTTFAFADKANDYAKVTEPHRSQALNVSGGYVKAGGKANQAISTFLVTYQRRWGFAAGSDTTRIYCHPVEQSTATSCESTALPAAAPISKPSHLTQLDVRHFFSWPLSPGLRITRNFTAGFSTYETPVYFISKDAKEGRFSFTGGVTAGYRDGGSAKGRFVTVFFGTLVRPSPK
jgi:hypothetical protein